MKSKRLVGNFPHPAVTQPFMAGPFQPPPVDLVGIPFKPTEASRGINHSSQELSPSLSTIAVPHLSQAATWAVAGSYRILDRRGLMFPAMLSE